MEKDYIIQKLAIAKAQLEINYLELEFQLETLKKELEALKGSEEHGG